jgi:hypothetical protein
MGLRDNWRRYHLIRLSPGSEDFPRYYCGGLLRMNRAPFGRIPKELLVPLRLAGKSHIGAQSAAAVGQATCANRASLAAAAGGLSYSPRRETARLKAII